MYFFSMLGFLLLDNLIPTFGQPSWLQTVQKEIQNCSENIGLIDLSANSFFDITVSHNQSSVYVDRSC